jgi:hypothetical protein
MKYVDMLTDEAVLSLARQKYGDMRQGVRLAAFFGYWGAPVSGRFDEGDFFTLWAVTKADEAGTVFLHGAHDGDWNIEKPFECFKNEGGIKLWKLNMNTQYEFPSEFVIKLQSAGGASYDNNNGENYHVKPYSYAFTSAIAADGIVLTLSSPVNVWMYDV